MARLYRTFSFAAEGMNEAAVASVYAQIKTDIQADIGFLNHVFSVPGSNEYLFFWPAQFGTTPDYTNDDVPIWCIQYKTGSSARIDLFPYRGAPSLFDGSQSTSPTVIFGLIQYWQPQLGQNVQGSAEFSYAIASDVPLFVAMHVRDDWDWNSPSAGVIQETREYAAVVFNRVAADWTNGLATRYGVIDVIPWGFSCTAGGARSSNAGDDYQVWSYPAIWCPVAAQSKATFAGVQSPATRTTLAPIFPRFEASHEAIVVCGDVRGVYSMVGRPTSIGEIVAPGMMAFGPVRESENGSTIAFPACPLAT